MISDHVCHRPAYCFPALDQSLQRDAFARLQVLTDRDWIIEIDDDGRQWFPRALTAVGIYEMFAADLTWFLRMAERRYTMFACARALVTAHHHVASNCGSATTEDIAAAVEAYSEAYRCILPTVVLGNLVVEVAVAELRRTLGRSHSTASINRLIGYEMRFEVVEVAAAVSFSEDTRGSKEILAVKSEPVCIFREYGRESAGRGVRHPSLWQLEDRRIDSDAFSALLIATNAGEFAEEFRYADYSVRSGLRALVLEIGRRENISDVRRHSVADMLSSLRASKTRL